MHRSRARISISQIMLVLTECREIPIVKRALPIFEDILSKKNLDILSPRFHGPISTHPNPRNSGTASTPGQSHAAASASPSQAAQSAINWQLHGDFFGLDFVDDSISDT